MAAISKGRKWVRRRAQSKYGLIGYSAKTGKNFIQGSQEHFLHKSAIWDRTPPTYTSNAVYMCAGGFMGPKSSDFNYLDSFKSYYIFCDFIVPMWSLWSPHCPCHPHIVPIIPRRSLCGPHTPPWLWSPLSPPHMVPTPLWSPCCPCCAHVIPVIPTSSLSSPHHLDNV